jgi:hypothetical protein
VRSPARTPQAARRRAKVEVEKRKFRFAQVRPDRPVVRRLVELRRVAEFFRVEVFRVVHLLRAERALRVVRAFFQALAELRVAERRDLVARCLRAQVVVRARVVRRVLRERVLLLVQAMSAFLVNAGG